ncbi:unnamed protein product [Pleuronectes platessa]|uniref:Uncharacterized protein n=1 Tax=Pleuronectes platessa TaxID=8262 RepID=A0A9N7W0H3_PLEPL|nr:unnamed protein product [Pleuronectes platessa]
MRGLDQSELAAWTAHQAAVRINTCESRPEERRAPAAVRSRPAARREHAPRADTLRCESCRFTAERRRDLRHRHGLDTSTQIYIQPKNKACVLKG